MVNNESNKSIINNWVDEYTSDLLKWTFHKVSNLASAEDLVQETFIAAYQSIDKFEQRSNPKTWLIAILNRKIADYYRKHARIVEKQLSQPNNELIEQTNGMFDENASWKTAYQDAIWDNELELLDNIEFNLVLKKCLEKLPLNWHASLTAKYFLQKNAQQTCKELNITPTNYWQMLHRAKLMMKKCLVQNWFNK